MHSFVYTSISSFTHLFNFILSIFNHSFIWIYSVTSNDFICIYWQIFYSLKTILKFINNISFDFQITCYMYYYYFFYQWLVFFFLVLQFNYEQHNVYHLCSKSRVTWSGRASLGFLQHKPRDHRHRPPIDPATMQYRQWPDEGCQS